MGDPEDKKCCRHTNEAEVEVVDATGDTLVDLGYQRAHGEEEDDWKDVKLS